jgi:hypothetical protein
MLNSFAMDGVGFLLPSLLPTSATCSSLGRRWP